MGTKIVTDASFPDEVLTASGPVLVDFWADWCGPCRAIAPALEQIGEELGDRLKVVKINVDENTEAPRRYGVRSIPTLMLFKSGEVSATTVGAHPKQALQRWIEAEI